MRRWGGPAIPLSTNAEPGKVEDRRCPRRSEGGAAGKPPTALGREPPAQNPSGSLVARLMVGALPAACDGGDARLGRSPDRANTKGSGRALQPRPRAKTPQSRGCLLAPLPLAVSRRGGRASPEPRLLLARVRVQVIASAGIVRGEPKQLTPRYCQSSLAGEVSNLASQTAVIAAARKARDGLGGQRYRAFILHSGFMPENAHNVKEVRGLIGRSKIAGCYPAVRPHTLRGSDWPRSSHGRLGDPRRREQLADQSGPLPKAPRLGGTRGGECGLDPFQHSRQRDGEGEKGAVEIGGVVHFGSSVRLSRPCQ